MMGLGIEAAMILVFYALAWSGQRRFEMHSDSMFSAPAIQVSPADRERLIHMLSDSLGVRIDMKGSEVHLVPAAPKGDTLLTNMVRIGDSLGRAATGAALVLATLFLVIPVSLGAITLVWIVRRKKVATSYSVIPS